MSADALFDLAEFEETRAPEWVPLGTWDRCGLCGTKGRFSRGGSDIGTVCDGCADVDGCRIRDHEVVFEVRPGRLSTRDEMAHCTHCTWWLDEGWHTQEEAERMAATHVVPRHTSRWGESHRIDEHDRLVAAQAKRRKTYLAKGAPA